MRQNRGLVEILDDIARAPPMVCWLERWWYDTQVYVRGEMGWLARLEVEEHTGLPAISEGPIMYLES